jgi:hypothetical protein
MKHYADEDEMRDDLRETLDKEWQQGYDKGAADERASIVEWLRTCARKNPLLSSFDPHSADVIADAIEHAEHEE